MMIWGVVAIVYAAMVVVIAVIKPEPVWKMRKIKFFVRHLGDRGTEIFFYVWALVFLILGIYLISR